MRHGKAEELAMGVSDEKRKLTAKGRKKAEAAARGLAYGLRENTAVQIWSSPLVRARQTAEILSECLDGIAVRIHPAIATGDLDILASDWRIVENENERTVVVVVGHEPYLSMWTERMTGNVLHFKKTGAAGLKISGGEGRLRWYASPSALACLDKKNK